MEPSAAICFTELGDRVMEILERIIRRSDAESAAQKYPKHLDSTADPE